MNEYLPLMYILIAVVIPLLVVELGEWLEQQSRKKAQERYLAEMDRRRIAARQNRDSVD